MLAGGVREQPKRTWTHLSSGLVFLLAFEPCQRIGLQLAAAYPVCEGQVRAAGAAAPKGRMALARRRLMKDLRK
jgi:hypothetical protein